MIKNLRFLFAIVTIVALLSSCKKTTDLSLLTGHKWSLTAHTRTYSDSIGVSHNLIQTNVACQNKGYTEFHDYGTNSSLRLAYTYQTSTCPGYSLPAVGVSSWNIDPDNTVLYLNGSITDGTGGMWFTIASISGSSLVLTTLDQRVIGSTGTPPNQTLVYDSVTETWTYSAQ
jgi:hypothetical protein